MFLEQPSIVIIALIFIIALRVIIKDIIKYIYHTEPVYKPSYHYARPPYIANDQYLSKKKYNELMNISLKVHNLLKCRGVTRSDFKYYKNNFYLLEINTQPGMTKLSLVPEISAYSGINFINLIKIILKDASTNK